MRAFAALALALFASACADDAETTACRQQMVRFDDFGVRRMSTPLPKGAGDLGPGFTVVRCIPNEDGSSCRYRDERGVTYDATYWATDKGGIAQLDLKTADVEEGAALPWGLRRDDSPARAEARLKEAGLSLVQRSRTSNGRTAISAYLAGCGRVRLGVEFDKTGPVRAAIMAL
ncbi:hypothetical protein [Caulobacter sp. 17J65-9]|uniref:hypothetical protein n=1 Tax=Caulobacter sp. 17J65-9 TaxID=2709382 RepID=UPI0013C6395B|nr:hypothetical protein [Caulobacter sp. 17J65-9]NEX92138.1 hypothetical protein [Caulobacter sp. 17J65-9]